MHVTLTIDVKRDTDGSFFASCDQLPGCLADGNTPQQAVEHFLEAAHLYVESVNGHGDALPWEN